MVINSSNIASLGQVFFSDASVISMLLLQYQCKRNDLGKIVILKYDDCIANEPRFPKHFWKLSIRSNISNIKSSLSKVLLYIKKYIINIILCANIFHKI